MGAKNAMRRDIDDERPSRRASARSNSRSVASDVFLPRRVASFIASVVVFGVTKTRAKRSRHATSNQSVDDDDVADVAGTSRGGASRAILRRASRIRTIAISRRRAAQTSSHRRRALARPARRLSSARRRARRRVPRTRRSRRPGASAHAPPAHDKITRHAQFGLVLERLQERVKSRVVRADLHVRELVQKRREHAILIHPPHRPSSPRSRAKQQSDPLSSIEVISPQLGSSASRGRRRREFGELIHDPTVTTHDAVPTPRHAFERDARAPT